ncbi:MAG: hypothetical protein R3C16_03875 [Hyphomonadaceae bacterium]
MLEDILALAGLKEVRTGDAVRSEQAGHPSSAWNSSKLSKGGGAEVEGRPGKAGRRAGEAGGGSVLRVSTDNETGQTIPAMGRLHRHQDRHSAPQLQSRSHVGAPQVAYREKLGKPATITYTHKKQTGGSGHSCRSVKIEFEPGELGSGFKFENKIVGGNAPKEYVPGVVKKASNMAKENGLLAGFPVIDVTARPVDGKYHDVDSNVLTFQIASQAAFRELKEKGDPRLLEPIMKVEVTSPEEYVGSVIGDLNSRRGMIQGQDMRGNATIINAMVPLANMFGYVTMLRRSARAARPYVMEFSHYEEVPRAVATEVLAKLRA